MATPKLSITLRNTDLAIDKLETYRSESLSLEAKYQRFIAEMIMLRLFSIFEESVAEIAFKLASGASYTNGRYPALHQQAGSMAGARGLFLTFRRRKQLQYLQWTKADLIKKSVKYVIPTTETFVMSAQRNGNLINDMRRVRNALAHNSTKVKQEYGDVVRSAYGANIRIPPGVFLSTTKRTTISNLNRYMSATKLILKDIASGI